VIPGSLVYLVVRHYVGFARQFAAKLKRPQYLLSVLLIGLYFMFILAPMSWFGGMSEFQADPDMYASDIQAMRAAAGALLPLIFALAWIGAAYRPAPVFTIAEASQLFTLPLGHRQLVMYALLRSMAMPVLAALFSMLFSARMPGTHPLYIGVGVFVIACVMLLNQMLARLVANRRLVRGTTSRLALAAPGLVMLALLFGCIATTWQPLDLSNIELDVWAPQVFKTGLTAYALWPFHQLASAGLASSPLELGVATLVGAGMLGALFAGVMSVRTPFHEEALRIAEQQGQKQADFKRLGFMGMMGASRKQAVKPTRLKLAPTGPAWRAWGWQILVAESRAGFRGTLLRLAPFLPVVFIFVPFLVADAEDAAALGFALIVVTITTGGMGLLMLPDWIHASLTNQLRRIEVIKLIPLRGADVVRASVYSGTLVGVTLSLPLIAMACAAAMMLPYIMGVPLVVVMGVGLVSAVAAIPAMVGTVLALDALFAAMLPAWSIKTAGPASGPEGALRFVLTWFFRFLMLPLAGLVPGAVGIAVGTVAHMAGLEVWGIAAGVWAGAAVAWGQVEIMNLAAGRRLDMFDPAEELLQ
jgi:hypothetical protein